MKMRGNRTPKWWLTHQGVIHSKKKLFVKRESLFRTGYTDAIERNFKEFCTAVAKDLLIQSASERKKLITDCEEYLRLTSLSETDDPVEKARRAEERSSIENEILKLNENINVKIQHAAQSIYRAQSTYNAQLTAYYSGLKQNLDIDQNGMLTLSIDYSPFSSLMNEWVDERKRVRRGINIIRNGVEHDEEE